MTSAYFKNQGLDKKNVDELQQLVKEDERLADIYSSGIRNGAAHGILLTIALHCYHMGINKAVNDMLMDAVKG